MKKVILLLAVVMTLASCDLDGYGPSVESNGVEVFYKPDSIKEQAQRFSVMMDTMGYGENGTASFQILKDSIVNIKMVAVDQYHTDKSLDYSFNAVALLAQMQIFEDDDVQMHLTDDRFNIVRSLDVVEK